MLLVVPDACLFASGHAPTRLAELLGRAYHSHGPFDERRVHHLHAGGDRAAENVRDASLDVLHRLLIVHSVQANLDFGKIALEHVVGILVQNERHAPDVYMDCFFHIDRNYELSVPV